MHIDQTGRVDILACEAILLTSDLTIRLKRAAIGKVVPYADYVAAAIECPRISVIACLH
jgi:hypothetical protein